MRPRYVTTREEHIGLRGGEGLITTYTKVLKKWILFGGPSPKKRAIKLVLSSGAWIGRHQHTDDSEIYITFNREVTFNGNENYTEVTVTKDFNVYQVNTTLDVDVHDIVVERNGQKVVLDDFLMERHAVTDENGNQIEFEAIDVYELNGNTYFALLEILPEGEETEEVLSEEEFTEE